MLPIGPYESHGQSVYSSSGREICRVDSRLMFSPAERLKIAAAIAEALNSVYNLKREDGNNGARPDK